MSAVSTVTAASTHTFEGRTSDSIPQPGEEEAKKSLGWTVEEDAVILRLRSRGNTWHAISEEISKHYTKRSANACRLHYQNYLERGSEWDEERRNALAESYERHKAEMWRKIAEELQVPWYVAEAMHWEVGQEGMAVRANKVPFRLTQGKNCSSAGTRPVLFCPASPLMVTQSPGNLEVDHARSILFDDGIDDGGPRQSNKDGHIVGLRLAPMRHRQQPETRWLPRLSELGEHQQP
ncbi:hypothetical protein Purlil1_13734 [Purpureocillium lilacinum]|uniref:Uncharacterized protein n=1 Tax=Purpureocillium lilacinum TaxID=33203 RepID=A0ABR0BD93_PURLI|nr:hypothetical protein Purlil1_13734 [Purpureocillium lilacinum]